MIRQVAVDNDLALKLCFFGLVVDCFACVDPSFALVLPTSRFVLRRRIDRDTATTDKARVYREVDELLLRCTEIDVSEDEVRLATELEQLAIDLNVELDTGESLLAAVCALRQLELLMTGDKRAIAALEVLVGTVQALAPIRGRVAALEQVLALLVGHLGGAFVRERVCSSPSADRALAICFSCYSPDVEFSPDGLESYIEDLRIRSKEVLCTIVS